MKNGFPSHLPFCPSVDTQHENDDKSNCQPRLPTHQTKRTMTSQPKRTPSTFSSLPRELRDRIYAYIFINAACGPSKTYTTLCETPVKDKEPTEQIFVVLARWLEESRIAHEMCVALYHHSTFRHGGPGTDLRRFLRHATIDALLPPRGKSRKCCKLGAQQPRRQPQFTVEAFLANISVSISLRSERGKGASNVLYQLLGCPRLRNLTVNLKMSAYCAGTYDGDGRKWALPLSEIAHACERLQRAAGERLRLVVYFDEAFWGEHVLDEFDERGVSCRSGVGKWERPERSSTYWRLARENSSGQDAFPSLPRSPSLPRRPRDSRQTPGTFPSLSTIFRAINHM